MRAWTLGVLQSCTENQSTSPNVHRDDYEALFMQQAIPSHASLGVCREILLDFMEILSHGVRPPLAQCGDIAALTIRAWNDAARRAGWATVTHCTMLLNDLAPIHPRRLLIAPRSGGSGGYS